MFIPLPLVAVSLMFSYSLVCFGQADNSGSIAAQEDPSPNPALIPPNLTAKPLESRIEDSLKLVADSVAAIEGSTKVSEEAKKQLIESWAGVKKSLDNAAKAQTDLLAYQEKIRQIKATAQQLAQPTTKPKLSAQELQEYRAQWSKLDTPRLASLLAEKQGDLDTYEQELKNQAEEPARRVSRLAEINTLDVQLAKQLATLGQQPSSPTPGEGDEAALLRTQKRLASILELETTLAAHQAEKQYYKQSDDLLPRLQSETENKVQRLQKIVDALAKQTQSRREREAISTEQAMVAEREKVTVKKEHPALIALAEKNEQLAHDGVLLVDKLNRALEQEKSLSQKTANLKQDFDQLKSLVEVAGLTNEVGYFLRRRREDLSNSADLTHEFQQIQSEHARLRIKLYEYNNQRNALSDIDAAATAIAAPIVLEKKPLSAEREIRRIKELLVTKQKLLSSLATNQKKYQQTLLSLLNLNIQMKTQVDEFIKYIDQRVLWVRSDEPLSISTFVQSKKVFQGLIQKSDWVQAGTVFLDDLEGHVLLNSIGWLALMALIGIRKPLRTQIAKCGANTTKHVTQHRHTFMALYYTVLLAAGAPLLIWFIGWRLSQGAANLSSQATFTKSLATTLMTVGPAYFSLALLRQICRPNGLGEAHFLWGAASTQVVRGNLKWFMPLSLTLLGVSVLTSNISSNTTKLVSDDSLGRLCFIANMLLCMLIVRRVSRPIGVMLFDAVIYKPSSWLERIKAIWYPLALSLPATLTLLAIGGYYYTATNLARQLYGSFCFLLILLVAWALTMRWLLVARRRLAVQQARQRLTAAREGEGQTGPTAPLDITIPELDISAVNTQTHQLLASLFVLIVGVGLWLIWVPVLPALGYLDQLQLWPSLAWGEGVLNTPENVTLANLLFAMLVLLMTTIGARNIPGLLEIAILQKLPMEQGARHAIALVSKYIITVIGVIVAFSTMGIGWTKIQWLVAAVSVGLGFGLQEIFANFISGLIILFERPIRLGDVVTVADTTGVVSRIQIRATTITDWDRKELLIPNKEFITNKVMNWTLSNRVLRLVIKVGVAYGSDVSLVKKTLLRIATKHPNLLDDPLPSVTFEEFGDSTLNFTLRTYLVSIDYLLSTKNDLHTSIDEEFNKLGIEIAFPQIDLHVRSMVTEAIPPMAKKEFQSDSSNPHLDTVQPDNFDKDSMGQGSIDSEGEAEVEV